MAGYFTVLLFSFNKKPLSNLPVYFVVHRAVFSVAYYVVFCIYEVYSNNINNINFAAIWGDIIYIISFFLLTYVPLYFYKRRKKPKLTAVEA